MLNLSRLINKFVLALLLVALIVSLSMAQPPVPLPTTDGRYVLRTSEQGSLGPSAFVEPVFGRADDREINECNSSVGNLFCMKQNDQLGINTNNSVACVIEFDGDLMQMAETRYYRLFDLDAYASDPEAEPNADFVVSSVGVAIDKSIPAEGLLRQPLYINIYQTTLDKLDKPGIDQTVDINTDNTALIASYHYDETSKRADIYQGVGKDDDSKILHFPFHAVIQKEKNFIIEVVIPESKLIDKDGTQSNGNLLYIGSNTKTQTAPSYIAAPGCGISRPTLVEDIGALQMRTIIYAVGVYESHVNQLVLNPSFEDDPVNGLNINDWCIGCEVFPSEAIPKTALSGGAFHGSGFIQFKAKTTNKTTVKPNALPLTIPIDGTGEEYIGMNFAVKAGGTDKTKLQVNMILPSPYPATDLLRLTITQPTCFPFPLPAAGSPPPPAYQCPTGNAVGWQGFSYWSQIFQAGEQSQLDSLTIQYKDDSGKLKFDFMNVYLVRLGDI